MRREVVLKGLSLMDKGLYQQYLHVGKLDTIARIGCGIVAYRLAAVYQR